MTTVHQPSGDHLQQDTVSEINKKEIVADWLIEVSYVFTEWFPGLNDTDRIWDMVEMEIRMLAF